MNIISFPEHPASFYAYPQHMHVCPKLDNNFFVNTYAGPGLAARARHQKKSIFTVQMPSAHILDIAIFYCIFLADSDIRASVIKIERSCIPDPSLQASFSHRSISGHHTDSQPCAPHQDSRVCARKRSDPPSMVLSRLLVCSHFSLFQQK